MASPAVALWYSTLLASLASNPNYTLFADDHGALHVIDTREPVFTQSDYEEIVQAAHTTTFLLYTQNNRQDGQPLVINDKDSVKKSFWNPAHPTRILTHGWQVLPNDHFTTTIRDAYLDVGDYNVIVVDWSKMAKNPLYWKVAKSVPLVAQHVTELIDFLQTEAGLDPSTTIITGHSLGGHIAGLAARNAKGEISEVIALDPAKSLFESKGPGERVDKSDATRVQVIHTSILGLSEAIGEADFYPNGGKNQPGCGLIAIVCEHARSFEYYAESILNPKGFRAGNVFMGGPSLDPNARGKYILQTAKRAPFALG